MTVYYPGAKVDTNVEISKLFYTLEVSHFSDNNDKIYEMKTPKAVPSDFKIIEAITTSKDPRFYRVIIILYRSFDNCPPVEVDSFYLAPGLADFLTQTSLNEFRVVEYKETVKQLQSVNRSKNFCITQVSVSSPKRFFETELFPKPKGNEIENPQDPFSLRNIENELKARLGRRLEIESKLHDWKEHNIEFSILDENIFPAQKSTSLCGPAAYFYCLLRDRPDLYRRSVKDLWEVGKTRIGKLSIDASESGKPKSFFENNDPKLPKLLGIDWITMGSLRNSENALLDYDRLDDAGSAREGIAGMTTHWEIAEWLRKSGAVDVINLVCPLDSDGNSLEELIRINEYARKGYKVIQLLSPFYIFQNSKDTSITELHWLVWESPITSQHTKKIIDINSNLDEFIDLAIFTWGWCGNLTKWQRGIYTSEVTLKKFLYASRGAVVFSKIE
ncbi:hypothetical protein HYE60_00705 [Aggregatibacter actinomycetemcomitans]|uniref:hypothetical protein n=1 Tax=Aggregatibacter actinomycetemcomitans TaxID=714 RepID=UPI00197B5FF1|nr:hypothetical protein [Aggregatibacter actinomycetemcomitans]MBN6073806.1 hypothetical protein [Aggregatibacter actinomycetemcomitans]